MPDQGLIAVCMKWVPLRADVDPLSGRPDIDEHFCGASPADQAALEWGLRAAERWAARVMVVTLGPAAAEPMLRDALACGADDARRLDGGHAAESDGRQLVTSAATARALAAALCDLGDGAVPLLTLCGDWSLDRGSASVPPYLAHELGVAQACGLVGLEIDEQPGHLHADRRLDGGRRELLALTGPIVVSVEGAAARLRRAPLAGVLRANKASLDVVPVAIGGAHVRPVRTRPFRPRARILAGPDASADSRSRVIALTGSLSDRTHPQRLTLDPAAAADRIVEQLRAWGYD